MVVTPDSPVFILWSRMTAEGRPVFISCCVAITVPHVLQFSSADVKGYVHPEMKNSFNKALTPRTDGKSGVRVCSPQNISGASQQNSVTAFFFPKQLKQMGTCFKMEKTRGNKNIKWLHTAWLALSKSVSHFKALAALDWDPQVWLCVQDVNNAFSNQLWISGLP